MEKQEDLKKSHENSQEKEVRTEIIRKHIVKANRKDPNVKHIESAARKIQSKINNFNSPMNGRSAKVMPKSKVTGSIKENQKMDNVALEEKMQNVFKTAHTWGTLTKVYHSNDPSSHSYILHPEHVDAIKKLNDGESTKFKDETGNNVTAHRKGETIHFTGTPIRTGSAVTTADRKYFMEEVEINEAPKGSPARPKSHMDTIVKASRDAAKRAPGATPSWLLKATKIKKEEVVQVDETKMNEPQKDAVKKAIDLRGKIGMRTSTSDAKKIIKFVKNEEVELEEGRGRPAKVGSAAWHRQQAASKSGEGGEQEADKNIVNQMRKKPVGEHHSLVFNNGEKKQVHVQHVNKALSMLANTAKPADREKLQNSLSHSHDRFMATIKSGKAIEDAPRAKVSLGKMKAESVDPETASSDRKAKKPFLRRDSEGVLRVHSRSGGPSTRDVVDATTEAVTYYDPAQSEEAEEKREGQGAPKGSSHDMTKDSCDRMQAMSPQAFKQKFKLPPTLGNVAAGGEDTTYAGGKYSVAEEKTLNNLYDNLSEENKEIFNELLQTEEGIEKLLQFANSQGY